jgi:hypothetical protein
VGSAAADPPSENATNARSESTFDFVETEHALVGKLHVHEQN